MLDTVADLKPIRKEDLPSICTNNIRTGKYPGLIGAWKPSVIFDVLILVHIRLGHLSEEAGFKGVTSLAVPRLWGTRCIDRFVEGIYPQDRNVVPFDSHPVAIVDSLEQSAKNLALKVEGALYIGRMGRYHLVRFSKGMHIDPIWEAIVLVKTSSAGIPLTDTHPNRYQSRATLVANGLQ